MEQMPTQQHANSASGQNKASGGFVAAMTQRPILFGGLWGFLFLFLFATSWSLGIVPKLDADDEEITAASIAEASPATADDTPVAIVIDAINLDAVISNPSNSSVASLDEALLDGVVHYPGSGDLDDHTNLFLLGHSTGFRVVQNEAFKIFNNLKNLKENDLIRVRSTTHEYVYRVTSVALVNADETFVELSTREKKLTLSTCNSLGKKEERYVVKADFVGSFPFEGRETVGLDL